MRDKKLSKLVKEGYQEKHDLSCSETILYGANQVYDLGLDKQTLKVSAGFGGGMGIESVCGALTGGIMVLGLLFVEDRAHENEGAIYELIEKFLTAYQEKMGEIDCASLKDKYYEETDDDLSGCRQVVLTAAETLEEFIEAKKGSV